MKERKLRRVQIDMSEKAFARLEWLRDETDAASISEVIRDALELREAIVRLANEGNKIIAENPRDGTKVHIILP